MSIQTFNYLPSETEDHRFNGEEGVYVRLADHASALAAKDAQMEFRDFLLTPRLWTRKMSDAWNRALPDMQAAFEALRNLIPKAEEP